MATPVWTTTAGKLASIDEQVSYSLQLEANTADSTAITYSVIAGSPIRMEWPNFLPTIVWLLLHPYLVMKKIM